MGQCNAHESNSGDDSGNDDMSTGEFYYYYFIHDRSLALTMCIVTVTAKVL